MRNRIIMATIEEVNENGIRFLMADLAARLAVSKSTLYAHFGSKEELIGAVVDYFIQKNRHLQEEIMNNDKLDLREKLEALLLSGPKSLGHFSRFILELKRHMPKEMEKLDEFRQQGVQQIESVIKEGISSGVVRPIELAVLNVIFYATINEFLLGNFLMQNNLTVFDAVSKMTDILYYGMVVPSAGENTKDIS